MFLSLFTEARAHSKAARPPNSHVAALVIGRRGGQHSLASRQVLSYSKHESGKCFSLSTHTRIVPADRIVLGRRWEVPQAQQARVPSGANCSPMSSINADAARITDPTDPWLTRYPSDGNVFKVAR